MTTPRGSGRFDGTLDFGSVFKLVEWNQPEFKPMVVGVSVDVNVLNAAGGGAPASSLPRARLTWGHGRAQQRVVVDLRNRIRFTVPCSNLSIEAYTDQDDTVTPTVPVVWEISGSVTLGEGNIGQGELTYITHAIRTDASTAGERVPKGAHRLCVVTTGGSGPSFSPSLPRGWIRIQNPGYWTGAAGAATFQRFDLNELVNNWQPMIPTPQNDGAGGGNWYFDTPSAANAEYFRIMFGIEV